MESFFLRLMYVRMCVCVFIGICLSVAKGYPPLGHKTIRRLYYYQFKICVKAKQYLKTSQTVAMSKNKVKKSHFQFK